MLKTQKFFRIILHRTFQKKYFLPSAARLMSFVFIFTNVAFAHRPQTSVWDERKKSYEVASLPAGFQPFLLGSAGRATLKQSLLKATPAIQSALKGEQAPKFVSETRKSPLVANLPETFFSHINVREVHHGSSQTPIVLIEDVHQNLEAQSHISRALTSLGQVAGAAPVLVALEGAHGGFKYPIFHKFPNQKIVREVADSFLATGDIGGPAHAGFTSAVEPGMRGLFFVGVDDPTFYRANVAAYTNTKSIKEKTLAQIAGLKKSIDAQKKSSFTPQLLAFDAAVEAHRNGQLPLGEFVRKLDVIARSEATGRHSRVPFRQFTSSTGRTGIHISSSNQYESGNPVSKHVFKEGLKPGFPIETFGNDGVVVPLALEQFLAAYDMEKSIDFARVESERTVVLEKLVKKMGENDLKNLIGMSLSYQEGSITFGAYYDHLRSLCRKNGVDLKLTPHFDEYVRYVLLADGIQADKLFDDINQSEKKVYDALAQNQTQKSLIEKSRQLYLARELVNFSLTSDQWEEYRTTVPRASSLVPRNDESFFSRGTRNEELGTSLKPFERFYVSAEKRSEKMVENLGVVIPAQAGIQVTPKASSPHVVSGDPNFLKMDSRLRHSGMTTSFRGNDGLTVLVAGGYHTLGLTKLMRDKQLSYVVVTPKITTVDSDSGSAYLSVFDREKTSLEKIFAGQKLFVVGPVAGPQNPINPSGGSHDRLGPPDPTGALAAGINAAIEGIDGKNPGADNVAKEIVPNVEAVQTVVGLQGTAVKPSVLEQEVETRVFSHTAPDGAVQPYTIHYFISRLQAALEKISAARERISDGWSRIKSFLYYYRLPIAIAVDAAVLVLMVLQSYYAPAGEGIRMTALPGMFTILTALKGTPGETAARIEKEIKTLHLILTIPDAASEKTLLETLQAIEQLGEPARQALAADPLSKEELTELDRHVDHEQDAETQAALRQKVKELSIQPGDELVSAPVANTGSAAIANSDVGKPSGVEHYPIPPYDPEQHGRFLSEQQQRERDELRARLSVIAAQMVPPTGGLLAADEGAGTKDKLGTAGKRLKSVGLPETYENRQEMRRMMIMTPGLKQAGVNAVILAEDTLDNTTPADSRTLVQYLLDQGIVPGVKTDKGLEGDPAYPDEKDVKLPKDRDLTKLPALLQKAKERGLGFTKYRTTIRANNPHPDNMEANALAQAQQAKLTQAAGLVPIVEPEVVYDGSDDSPATHDLDASYTATTRMQELTFKAMKREGVILEGMILKTSMVLAGQKAPEQTDPETVGFMTLKGLLKTVPAEVPAIVFLSGGQKDDQATANLDAVVRAGQNRFAEARDAAVAELRAEKETARADALAKLTEVPWQISYSFGRGLQAKALAAWGGKKDNVSSAQDAMRANAQEVQRARQGLLKATPINVPANFVPALENHGLKAVKIYATPLQGQAVPVDLLNDRLHAFALYGSVAQSLGSIFFAGRNNKVKEIADGNAVFMARNEIQEFTRRNPDVAVVVIADEGKRDNSHSLELGSIFVGDRHINFTGLGNLLTILAQLRNASTRSTFGRWYPTPKTILYFVGDSLEKTNGLVIPEAATNPTDSNALFSFFIEAPETQLGHGSEFLNDDNNRIGGVSFVAPDDAGVTPFDLPSEALPKIAASIAKGRGLTEGTEPFDRFLTNYINATVVVALGPRSSQQAKSYEQTPSTHRHQAIIDDTKALQKRYPGLTFVFPGDGDLGPRVVANLGINLDGHHMVVFGRSGSTEARATMIAVLNSPNARFVHSYVSEKRTSNNYSRETAYHYTPEELKRFADTGIPQYVFEGPRETSRIKGKGILALTSVTGASKAQFGASFAADYKRVNVQKVGNGLGTIATNTILSTPQGNFLVHTVLQSDNIDATRNSIKTILPAAREYWSQQGELSTEVSKAALPLRFIANVAVGLVVGSLLMLAFGSADVAIWQRLAVLGLSAFIAIILHELGHKLLMGGAGKFVLNRTGLGFEKRDNSFPTQREALAGPLSVLVSAPLLFAVLLPIAGLSVALGAVAVAVTMNASALLVGDAEFIWRDANKAQAKRLAKIAAPIAEQIQPMPTDEQQEVLATALAQVAPQGPVGLAQIGDLREMAKDGLSIASELATPKQRAVSLVWSRLLIETVNRRGKLDSVQAVEKALAKNTGQDIVIADIVTPASRAQTVQEIRAIESRWGHLPKLTVLIGTIGLSPGEEDMIRQVLAAARFASSNVTPFTDDMLVNGVYSNDEWLGFAALKEGRKLDVVDRLARGDYANITFVEITNAAPVTTFNERLAKMMNLIIGLGGIYQIVPVSTGIEALKQEEIMA